MSLLDVGKNLFNSGKKAATDFLTQYPTPASYIQAKAQQPIQQTLQQSPIGFANQQFQQRIAQPLAQRIANTPVMPFLPSVTPSSYIQGQIINPIQQGLSQIQQPGLFNKGMGLASMFGGAMGATPQGALYNIGSGALAGVGQAIREKKNPLETIGKGINTPTSLATTGFGITNPIAALGVDLLSPSVANKGIKIAQAKGLLNIPGLSKIEGALADSKGFFDNIASVFQSGVSGADRKKVITELAQEAKRHASIFEMTPKEIEQAVLRSPEGWIKKLQEKSTLFLADRARATSYGVKTNIVNNKPSTGGEIGGIDKLAQEAKKYKSADEFIKANTNAYHGTSDTFTEFKLQNGRELGPNAIFVSPQKDVASYYAQGIGKGGKGKVMGINLADAKLFDYNNKADINKISNLIDKNYESLSKGYRPEIVTPQYIKDRIAKGDYAWIEKPQIQEFIKNSGFDGFKIRDYTGGDGIGVFDVSKLKTESQLTDIWNKAQSSGEIPKGVTKPVSTQQTQGIGDITQQNIQGSVPSKIADATQPQIKPTTEMQGIAKEQSTVTSDSIISEARKQIGTVNRNDKRSVKQVFSDLYTSWVDRYNPVVKAAEKAKAFLKTKKAELRPENDPEILLRRLTGAGGMADTRYQTELKPVIDQLDSLKIDKLDMDAYLANKRIAGFGQAGRDIYGADPVKAQQVVQAMEQKYGPQISQLADQLYSYQDKGLQELVQAGFISPEAAISMRGQNPDYAPLKRVMDDMTEYLGLPTRKLMQGKNPIYKIKGSTKQIDSPIENIIANTFQQRAAIEKNRVANSIVKLQEITDLGFKQVKESSPDTITVWKNGKKEFWDVGIDIADTAKGVNEENLNLVEKILQAPASVLRQGATGRNPEFMAPNIIRDQLDAGITSKYGYIPFVDYFSGLKSVLTNDKSYQSWAKSGAKIDLGEMSGRKNITDSFNQATKKQGLFRWFTNTLDVMGKYSEQPTRVGLYKRAMQKTGNELLSMMESRDATIDFARMGSKMKTANSIIPFLNVGVQGFDKLIRAAKANPAKLAFLGATYAAGPQIMSQIYNLTTHPEEYAEIPQYVKDANFVFVIGRNEKGNVDYVTVPKGNVTPTIANPIQSYLDYLYKVDGPSFKQTALSLFSDTLPVLSPGSSVSEIATKTIGSNLPQAVKPLAENLLNKSFYKYDVNKEQAKEIVPSYSLNKPNYLQSYEWTPQMYKTIGAVLDASPLKVQNLLEGYLAGYVKIPAQILDAAVSMSKGEKVEANDKTILRRFLQETIPSYAKPAPEKPESPPLMERITGNVSAAEKTVSEEKSKQKDIQARAKLRYSKNDILDANGKVFIKKDTESGVSIDTIDPSFQPKAPTYTGKEDLDKKVRDEYYGQITKKANDIYALYKASEAGDIKPGQTGYTTQDDANAQLSALKALRSKSSGGKKAPKIIIKKVTIPKIKVSTPKRTSVTNFSIKAPSMPKAKKSTAFKIKKMKPIKLAKLTIKSKNV